MRPFHSPWTWKTSVEHWQLSGRTWVRTEVLVCSLITDIEGITVFISTFKTKRLFEPKSLKEAGCSIVEQLCKNGFNMSFGDSCWRVHQAGEHWREYTWHLSAIRTADHLAVCTEPAATGSTALLRFKVSENKGWTNGTSFWSSSGQNLWFAFCFLGTFPLEVDRRLTAGPLIGDMTASPAARTERTQKQQHGSSNVCHSTREYLWLSLGQIPLLEAL